jgi:Protein of unknown function (DUF3108)
MHRFIHVLLASTAAAVAAAQPTEPPAEPPVGVLRPYQASYGFHWGSMNAGTMSFELRREGADEWTYINRNRPHGLFWLAPGADLTLTSRMRIGPGGIQPLLFTAAEPDGSAQKARVQFDWSASRATGVVEQTRIDMALKPGVQDDLSNQVALMYALLTGQAPAGISVFDKEGIRDYEFTRVGAETLQTPVGAVDTIVYESHKVNSPRSTRYWCAPAYGFVPMRAEQRRKGEVQWTMNLLSIHLSD